MFAKSGCNHINVYINRINWKIKSCQIGVHAEAAGRRGGGVPQCPIAGDANDVASQVSGQISANSVIFLPGLELVLLCMNL